MLFVNQSLIDMFASFFTLMTSAVKVDGTRMSANRLYDQFMCRIWVTRVPLWALLVTSTYGIFTTAFDRYVAVVYPIWYHVSQTRQH